MELQEFIQSGLLETYALGQCSPDEQALVEQMLKAHPEAQAELTAIEQALEGFASANAVAPPPDLKGKILDAIDSESAPNPRPVSYSTPKSKLSFTQMAVIAILALAAAFFGFKMNAANQQNELLQQQLKDLKVLADDCASRNQNQRQIFALLRDRDTKAVEATDGGKISTWFYYNSVREELAFDLSGMPGEEPNQYYQLWAIVDGKPFSLGMVDMKSPASWQKLKYIPNAQAYAVSRENQPQESAVPTVVIMVGKV